MSSEGGQANKNNSNDDDIQKDTKKKRQPPFQNLKKKKKRTKSSSAEFVKGTRRDYDNPCEVTPHEGSFAHPNLQSLFKDVVVPKFDDSERKGSKKKVAMLVAYLGSNYAGFQINVGTRTLQAEIELALYKARLINFSNFGYPHKYSWSTSGRTDKGVHANAQVVSCKIEIPPNEVDDMDKVRDRINAELPDDISVLDVKRTTRNFCAKTARSKVRYQYMIPSIMFHPESAKIFAKHGLESKPAIRGHSRFSPEEIKALRDDFISYRITASQMETLRTVLKLYEGTKPYHNFTRGMDVGDTSALRYIISFTCSAPFIGADGTEWIPTQVLGQSFLLNQIRKMIALAIDCVRGTASLDVMERALAKNIRMQLPIAPPHGLFLDMSVYDFYNERKDRGPSEVESLDWINQEDSPAMQRWKKFKEDVTLKHIVEEEATEGNFLDYLYLQSLVFDFDSSYRGIEVNPEESKTVTKRHEAMHQESDKPPSAGIEKEDDANRET